MHLILRYDNGQTADALLLKRDCDTLRVVLRGADETMELHQEFGRWLNDVGEHLTIEAILAMDTGLESQPRAVAAAGAAG